MYKYFFATSSTEKTPLEPHWMHLHETNNAPVSDGTIEALQHIETERANF